MAEESGKRNTSLMQEFLNNKNELGKLLANSLVDYFEQEKKPEIEFVRIYLETFKSTLESAGKELNVQYEESDKETRKIIDNHISNTGVNLLLSSSCKMMKKNKGILGFLEKILPILEIIKKIITQIIELFPNFLEKILKKIILPLLELLENIIKQILEMFGNKSASMYLKIAEKDFLITHPLWRNMLFETLDTSTD
jgi:hypothetical protein